MLTLNRKKIIGVSIFLAISLSTIGCVNPKDINWESTPITGTVLGTVESPNQYGPSTTRIKIKLDSGEIVYVKSAGEMPLIVKGKKVKLRRGTTDSGRKFYSFGRPFQIQEK